jgi:UDP-N-acetyl-D-glucosamine/UDP-N-acetyl-D-galactosamine dehydrogenase
MGRRIARECIRGLLRQKGRSGTVTILGITFKENVPDTRNSRVIDIVRELQGFGIAVQIADPMANAEAVGDEYGMVLTDLEALRPADAVILAVAHDRYVEGGWPLVQRLLKEGTGLVLDVKMQLDRATQPAGIELWRL